MFEQEQLSMQQVFQGFDPLVLLTIEGSSRLGAVQIPLMMCSVIALAIIIERLFCYSTYALSIRSQHWLKVAHKLNSQSPEQCKECKQQHCFTRSRSPAVSALKILFLHKDCKKSLREEVGLIWLKKQQSKLDRGLRVLSLIAVITPLLGLLGTVLGLMEMFGAMSQNSQGVEIAQLSNGLGLAMQTTCVGLMLAVPAQVASYLLGLWKQVLVEQLEQILNQGNLLLEGVDTIAAIANPKQQYTQSQLQQQGDFVMVTAND
ncbi:hypothetical protein DBZ36_02075 [Alginatibacterium sediminis]|uniref:MotA/TolQ/ExbB proton channel domain-containing protein n=1 Tax=Alginatibacterium sediminis TaxID=2164068 RepID=A0A420ELA7_9ALTE|nr:MotA/TolQ/ExbB proton channel family protein [Alginatibacterium sediminis]RKF21459.1 hypothetical protein DBZ36_02075 [Alginatibacterium sediminis]